jgi:arylsulfatase
VLVVVPPGASPKSSVCNDPVAAWDLLPTLLDIGRAQRKPRPLDGVSLWPALGGMELPADRVLYWKQPGASGEQVVRMGPWRAAVAANSKQVRLYDLQTDPESQTDVAGQHPEVLAKVIRQPAAPAQ